MAQLDGLGSPPAGVDTIQTQPTFAVGADRGNRGFGQQFNHLRARPQQNNYRLDGASINDYANGAPGSVLGGNLGVDAIQEFSVLTSNYSAEYGKTSGGVVNAITTLWNQWTCMGVSTNFSGTAHSTPGNFFDGAKIPSFKRNQFWRRDRRPHHKEPHFFFADYKAFDSRRHNRSDHVLPSMLAMESSTTEILGGFVPPEQH